MPDDRCRRLILMRHAKSSWAEAGQSDHARPLNPRGRADAPRVAQVLLDRGWAPVHVHASDAARTTETWTRMAPRLPAATWVRSRGLYLAGLEAIVAAAAHFPAGPGPVLVLGHNPGWEEAVSDLTGTPTQLTTGNAALLEGTGPTWPEALAGIWRLVGLLRPRELQL